MFETLLTDGKNLSTSGNIPFTLYNHSFDITQGIFPQREANSILVGGMQEPLTPPGFPIQSAGLLPATFPAASVTDSSLDPVTGEAMSGVYRALTAFATDPNFTDRMNVPFGESWDNEKAKALKEEWLRGNFSNIPLVKVVSSGDIAGANGAFGTATNTIYLSKEFLVQNATRLDALTGVLLEEVGHFIDSQVNYLDSPGDEGEIFAAVVQGKNLSQEKLQLLKAEDDRAIALIEGQEISIEQVANIVTVSAIDASAAEVISGQTANPGTYRITRSESTTAPLTVPYTMSGTSLNGTDYTLLNGTATIPAGLTFVDVALNVIDDTWIENNEAAILTVSPSTNYTLGATNTAIVTIVDNDQNTVTVSAIDASAAEVTSGQTANPGMYRITRNGSTSSALTVPYTMSGTGSNGTDYTFLNGTATIPAGLTFVDVALNVIDDTLIESNETAILTVSPSSNYTVGATNTATVTIADNDLADWFDLNIQDLGIRSTARVAASDSVINRNEMIGILRDAKDGSVIDNIELTNLRNLLTSNTRPFSIPQYVQNLTNKVVNSDVANQTYQGSYLGNLSANSSSTQMEKLIGKWFLGNDRPVIPSNYTYQLASGSLFRNGVSYQDINQGTLGDCYFLAGLGVTANRTPQVISDMFIPNGDNTYTVRFYRNSSPDFVTVDNFLPTNSWGQLVYASMGSQYNSSTNELWVALAEKAYAQINESGWINQNNTNSYESVPFAYDGYPGIVSGNPGVATSHVTGRNTSSLSITNIADTNQILNTFNNGQLISFSSNIPSGAASPQVVQNHAYVLVDYNSSTQKFKLFNPWGMNGGWDWGIFKPGILELSSSEIVANFSSWDYTLPPGQSSVNSSNSPRPNVLGMSAFS